jgi:hypothetical protein
MGHGMRDGLANTSESAAGSRPGEGGDDGDRRIDKAPVEWWWPPLTAPHLERKACGRQSGRPFPIGADGSRIEWHRADDSGDWVPGEAPRLAHRAAPSRKGCCGVCEPCPHRHMLSTSDALSQPADCGQAQTFKAEPVRLLPKMAGLGGAGLGVCSAFRASRRRLAANAPRGLIAFATANAVGSTASSLNAAHARWTAGLARPWLGNPW